MFPVLALVLAAPGSASTDKPSAPAAPYDPCQKQCFTDHKCCPSVLTALDPDECVDRASCLLPSRNDPGDWKARADMLEGTAPRAPESYADFYNMCDEMAGMFSSMEPACCVPEPQDEPGDERVESKKSHVHRDQGPCYLTQGPPSAENMNRRNKD
ncbi:hypothetical protein VUR80DRAFT_264 [Thermomyces stellatus]